MLAWMDGGGAWDPHPPLRPRLGGPYVFVGVTFNALSFVAWRCV
jgi:hypothetical protein